MEHAGFILASFGLTFLVVAGVLASIVIDHRALKRELARLSPVDTRVSPDQPRS